MRHRFIHCTILFSLMSVLSGCAVGFRRSAPRIGAAEKIQPSDSFLLPLKEATVLSSFGKRGWRFHAGVDLKGAHGKHDAIFASRAGRVLEAGKRRGYGRWVVIRHADGFISRYAHLQKILVKAGESVNALEKIGIVGATGRATTPHLHFEIITPFGSFVDPAPLIFKRQQSKRN